MSPCNAQSEICWKSVSWVQFFLLLFRTLSPATLFLCHHFPLEICYILLAYLYFSPWNMTGKKFTTLWFQVANHPAIAFKIFFIFPYDLEKVKSSSCWQKITKKRAFLSNWFLYKPVSVIKQWLECICNLGLVLVCWKKRSTIIV